MTIKGHLIDYKLEEARMKQNVNTPIHDYGFTFESEPDQSVYDQILKLKRVIVQMREMVLPLLEDLNRDTDKPMIRWSNRKATLTRIIEDINDITRI